MSEKKPPYRIPSMGEIAAIPWNGLSVCSTFAGAGGSSLGYRMAGFRVLWVNEFIEAARDVYAANARPGTFIDPRDIRAIAPGEVLDAAGLRKGELDILDGSPPCASFSTAGKGAKHWGEERKYSDTVQRTDDLFFEFVRLVDGLRPRVFVAENVSGLVKGAAKGQFLRILDALKLRSYSTPGYNVEARVLDAQWLGVPQCRKRVIFVGVRVDLERAPAFPKPLPYRYSIRDAIPWVVSQRTNVQAKPLWVGPDTPSPTISTAVPRDGCQFKSSGFVEAEADISRFAIGDEYDALRQGEQSSKYFSLVKCSENEPSPTITQRGGCSSVAGPVHPTEKRKFSIEELRRVCGFPDDFVLTGTYAEQWERLGRAVPPPMMFAVADTIRREVLRHG